MQLRFFEQTIRLLFNNLMLFYTQNSHFSCQQRCPVRLLFTSIFVESLCWALKITIDYALGAEKEERQKVLSLRARLQPIFINDL